MVSAGTRLAGHFRRPATAAHAPAGSHPTARHKAEMGVAATRASQHGTRETDNQSTRSPLSGSWRYSESLETRLERRTVLGLLWWWAPKLPVLSGWKPTEKRSSPPPPSQPPACALAVSSGFGPFGEHTVNASWIAVQELEKLGLGDSVDLHVYEIPVEYKTVQRLIPALWEKHSPQLVVHVGVSGMATAVTLEKCGHNKGYKGLDNCRFCPGSQCCVEDGPESIDSIIDMDAVCKRVTTLGLDVSVTISQDAGRYLCDFTYYTSLYQSHGRSAFVHVPPLGKPYNADQLGRALRAIIEEMLDVLEQSEGKISCRHKH
ncbi:PREDICTED: pyroglutamyl-peptidase 1 [Ceratotherium simum simum]|uniref:Pyroglutamyl-peptidase I n=2 Tax=Rhinocerotidae TaxID=9803 RepID=A0ABM1CBU9_CERSS|nr:PREDICTED: pyroglutamyl-peptidase 1 [Ceratotherium simum simum]